MHAHNRWYKPLNLSVIFLLLLLSAQATGFAAPPDSKTTETSGVKNEEPAKDKPVKNDAGTAVVQMAYTNVYIMPKELSQDTFKNFVAAYGKDSILHLIDNRIRRGVKFMNFEARLLDDQFRIAELLLLSKHFKLGVDTLNYPNLKLKSFILELYGNNLSKVSEFLDTAKLVKMQEQEMLEYLTKEKVYDNRMARIAIGSYGRYFNLPQAALDSFYSYYNNYDPSGKIEFCYAFHAFAQHNPAKANLTAKYMPSLYDELYTSYNLPAYVKRFADNYTDASLLDAYRILAYGLYMNRADLKKQSRDLMYLLSLQYIDGGWRDNLNSPSEDLGNRNTSIYALWALCAYRDLIANTDFSKK